MDAKIAVLVARWVRRCPAMNAADIADAKIDAYRVLFGGAADHLVHRSRPETYRGWRKDTPRRLAYLLGDAGYGLPLATEGGAPFRCRDRETNDLAVANYRAKRAAEAVAASV